MGDWAAAEEKAKGQRGVLTLEQLSGLGFSRNAIKWAIESGRLVRMFHHAYRFRVAECNDEQRGMAATLVAGAGAALSHATAATLWKLNGYNSLKTSGLHLSVPMGTRIELPRDVSFHRPRVAFTPYRHRGFMVTRLARTIVDIAPDLSDERLEVVLDAAQHMKDELPRWLREELPLHPAQWHHGISRLKRILDLREGIAPESPQETRVRRALRESGLLPPVLQFEIYDPNGFITRVDFAWPQHRVALHFDSFLWHARRHQFDLDAAQRARLLAIDWLSISLTKTALESSDWLIQLERTLKLREPQQDLFSDQLQRMAVLPAETRTRSTQSRSHRSRVKESSKREAWTSRR